MDEARTLVGLNVSGGREGVDAVKVRVDGIGLSARATVLQALRVPIGGIRIEDVLAGAVRKIAGDTRDVFCVGLMEPNAAAEAIADRTGFTVLTAFGARDIAAGGVGAPISPLADYLLARDAGESRLLMHLGGVVTLVWLPARAKVSDIVAFDAGPGNRFLDALLSRCTREKERIDTGNRGVQGRVQDAVLQTWLRHPYLVRKPPKTARGEFHDSWVEQCLRDARQHGLDLNDLLCTATHFVAHCVAVAVRQWLPTGQRTISCSGGGVRNGFLRQLLTQQLPGEPLRRCDDLGLPALARNAATAAVLAALTLDGVTGNLPQWTGASGGRLIGRIVPGDMRSWAVVSAWAAEQMGDYVQFARAA